MELKFQDGVIYLEGLFFLRMKMIRKNDSFVQQALKPLYQGVRYN
jgi:hypothetical protein